MIIDFEEELKRVKPSLEVDDIEQRLSETDLTDAGDLMLRMIGKFVDNDLKRTEGRTDYSVITEDGREQ